MAITYKDSGVDVERGYKAVELMKAHVKRTMNANVLGDLGSFGGFYALDEGDLHAPVLVAGTDGVGTKLKIAFAMDKHDTVGIDCVAMCVNDVVCQGARPLFFLDYIAASRIDPERTAAIVGGVAEGCVRAGCALIGGETAEMPGFYQDGEYDMAGFCVGVVARDKAVSGRDVAAGDALVGLASDGVHSNGFSLVRKLVGDTAEALGREAPGLSTSFGQALITPTRIYVKSVLKLMAGFPVKGCAHITGGGFIENIPRILPDGLCAVIRRGSWPVPPIFTLLQRMGEIPDESIYNTFNMGCGMVLAVPAGQARAVAEAAQALGERAYVIGEVAAAKAGQPRLILS